MIIIPSIFKKTNRTNKKAKYRIIVKIFIKNTIPLIQLKSLNLFFKKMNRKISPKNQIESE